MTDEKIRVYKFYSQKWGLEALRKRRLKITTLEELNDPFEFKAIKLVEPEFRRAYESAVSTSLFNKGMICFSKKWDNPVMWSHYADNHKGICLGFDIHKEFATEVKYVPERLLKKLNLENMDYHNKLLKELKNGLMEELCRTKFKHWEYEKEIRLFLTTEDSEKEGEYLFADFDDEAMKLREVILGSCYAPFQKSEQLGSSLELNVPIVTARCAFQNFSIVKQRSAGKQKTI